MLPKQTPAIPGQGTAPEEWECIDAAVADALDLPVGERDAFLAKTLQAKPEALAAARQLIGRADEAEKLFARPLHAQWQRFGEGTRLGPWQLVRQLGAGGMGVVWLARRADGEVEMQAAIKMLPPSLAGPLSDDAVFRQRFLQEKQILAKLQHPNIARLLEASTGQSEIAHFVMEYVDGQPLLAYVEEKSTAEKIAIFQAICQAIQYAHASLVVHRDLKPQNILVGRNGQPKVLDFGIGKILKETAGDGGATVQNAFSLDYASPEQIAGTGVGTGSDIYSLGLLLYEMLTGKRARQMRGTPMDVAARAIATFVAKPHPSLPDDLLAIVRKAAHPEPELRYATAQALAEDVTRFQNGLPVQAQRNTVAHRAYLFLRRNWLASLAAVVSSTLVVTLTIQTWLASEEAKRHLQQSLKMQALAEQQKGQAEEQRKVAEEQKQLAEEQKQLAEEQKQLAERQSTRLLAALEAESRQTQKAQRMEVLANQQREQAETNLRDLLAIYGSVTQSARRDVSNLTGGLPAAVRLTESSLRGLERLPVSTATQNNVLMLRAEAHERLAEFYGGNNGNLGDAERSKEQRAKAWAIWQQLYQAEPANPAIASRWLYAEFLKERQKTPLFSAAQADGWEARFVELDKQAPNRREVMEAAARFYFLVVAQDPKSGKARDRAGWFTKSLQIYRRLAARKDANAYFDDLRNVALCLKYLSSLGSVPDRQGMQYAEEAVGFDRERVTLEPSNFLARMDLGFSLAALADKQYTLRLFDLSKINYRESAMLRREAARMDPNNALVLGAQIYPNLRWAWAGYDGQDWKALEEALAGVDLALQIAKPAINDRQQQELLYLQAASRRQKGDKAGACALLEKSAKLQPPGKIVVQGLAAALAKCK